MTTARLRLQGVRLRPDSRVLDDRTLIAGSNNSGMSSVLDVLHFVLNLSDARDAARAEAEKWPIVLLARQLLASAEQDTCLPGITTQTSELSQRRHGPPATIEELMRAAEAAARLWLVALALLALALGIRSPRISPSAPRQESAPCGVIRLATPRVPRAPGSPVRLPAPSSFCVLTA
ncbi:hypothetical protein [Streptomyces sp. KL118A]|uniref:hypothetical protein n=1 Tax=Streptomyces sp. KL118A TaxID=3045153 RepID=UPI00278C6D58|nr:hypothetical protein [Streptomyces sp. KL118A]